MVNPPSGLEVLKILLYNTAHSLLFVLRNLKPSGFSIIQCSPYFISVSFLLSSSLRTSYNPLEIDARPDSNRISSEIGEGKTDS